MLYRAKHCAVRHDHETQRLEGDMNIPLQPVFRQIIFLYLSYQLYEVL